MCYTSTIRLPTAKVPLRRGIKGDVSPTREKINSLSVELFRQPRLLHVSCGLEFSRGDAVAVDAKAHNAFGDAEGFGGLGFVAARVLEGG